MQQTQRWAIETHDLRRIYRVPPKKGAKKGTPEAEGKELRALNGVSLTVPPGELFGLLGANGAGKTTLIKILTTLLAPSGGSARVDGLDVVADADELRRRINMVSGGETSGYGILTVRENLWMFAQFYGMPNKLARKRVDEMLEIVELTDKADTKIAQLSTGLRQKMNFCRGFITDPRVLFLDEPTLGLDVNAARTLRKFTRDWVSSRPDRTLLLTTHYMVEADELCDRVAIIDQGRILACDAPASLKRRLQSRPVFDIKVSSMSQGLDALEELAGVSSFSFAHHNGHTNLKFLLDSEAALGGIVSTINAASSQIISLEKKEPTLEDVFVSIVGHGLGEGDGRRDE